ncbi:OmpA/MotB family protein [Halorhodospira halophila]|uniref:OmpA/MotB domain protein n=1 Tax=Halorhodospira halophila (strain DSM 244 / SL1) TaxID=349124 RepID=A1WYM0_HALHL|nr:OmpA family protein [Halorhodospira halophila]ABM62782.1 OmpA/MotB domain protein [Halorhodospira halophila SL1]MBK1728095.1 OmpA family protein [Halorhodospira halophila]
MAEQTPTNRRTRQFNRQVQPEGEKDDDNSWLLVYLDVITLLLIVFVILLALLEPEEDDDREGLGDGILEGREHILEGEPSVLEGLPEPLDEADPVEVPAELEEAGIQAVGEEETLTFRLDDAVLFETGRAELQAEGQAAIDELIPIFQATGVRLSVEGHTDNIPIATGQFPSNWELSSARASAVLRYLEEQGLDPRRMRAIGYGDIRPIADNETAEGRAENRRVEITLHFGTDSPPEDLPLP